MNPVFSVDDFSYCFWAAPASNAAAGMSRSHSEWALERFLEEVSGAGDNVIGPSLEPPQPSISKAEEGVGDADAVEIERPNNQNHNPPPSDPKPTVPINSDDFRAILESKLELECAAVVLSRALAVKAEDSSAQAENHTFQSGSKVQGMLLLFMQLI
ncbi:Detected protein of confused Function [Hibiscus syriacus]|uniref:Detected protein of confused Function n=1 Tax=Hibiscus syriacus TaxID=106335 RepID=A0A6A2XZW1_HIBSY|nr:basic leucine zipper 25-like [Hibiscus syriacus]KAE8676210.1 Detected protein of confused Function [Hibiscus syriacus]